MISGEQIQQAVERLVAAAKPSKVILEEVLRTVREAMGLSYS